MRVPAKARIFLALYGLILLYRLIFWDLMALELLTFLFNTFFDVLLGLLLSGLIYSVYEKRWRLGRKLWLLMPLSIVSLLCLCVVLVGLHWVGYAMVGSMQGDFERMFWNVNFQIFDAFTILLVSTVGGYAHHRYQEAEQNRLKAEQIGQEKKTAELQFLRSQVNPHFVFNALNTLHFSIDKKNELARKMLTDFSDLFRFQLYECNEPTIALGKELTFIQKYLDLNEIRMKENMDVEAQLPTTDFRVQVPPLLLIPFIENALKHAGSMPGFRSWVKINLRVEEQKLVLDISNSKKENVVEENTKGGIGLKNVKRRLELLFPNGHELEIVQGAGQYKVHLQFPVS